MILPFIAQYSTPNVGFGLCLVTLFIFGIFAGLLQASVFAYSGMLPPKYIGSVMFGNGLSGIVINVLRAICLLIFPPDKDPNNEFYGSLVYFVITAILLLSCCFAQIMLSKNKFVQFYVNRAHKEKIRTERKISGVSPNDM